VGYTICLIIAALGFAAGTCEGVEERHRLYTKPDPTCTGGIQGSIDYPSEGIEQILAIPPDDPLSVYEGTVSGSDRREFKFTGLPMRKYNLVVIYNNSVYEGLRLHREDDTLTAADRAEIKAKIEESEPFYTFKDVHRLEGTTGRGNVARAICTFAREKSSSTHGGPGKGCRRTFKIALLKQVGPGWQIVRTRDLYPIWAPRGRTRPKHNYSQALSRIRVSDRVKELSPLSLRN